VAGLSQAVGLLYDQEGAVVETLGQVNSLIANLVSFDDDLSDINSAIETNLRQLEDLSRELEGAVSKLESDPDRLEYVEERLAAINNLLRAHGPSLDALIENRDKMTGELGSLQDLSSQKNDLEKKCTAARSVALELADQLSVQRRKVAVSLAKKWLSN